MKITVLPNSYNSHSESQTKTFLTSAVPMGQVSTPSADTKLKKYEAKLMGGTVTATPMFYSGGVNKKSQTYWQVSLSLPDNRHVNIKVPLSTQFGSEHLKPGSYAKLSLAEALFKLKHERSSGISGD